MSGKKVGKIRLRCLSDLQADIGDNEDNISKANAIECRDNKTPKKPKRAPKLRAATTAKKKSDDKSETGHIIVSSTAIKRTNKKEPLPGQLRIDAFFKSNTKSYKAEPNNEISPSKPVLRRIGRKRLFDEASTTTTDNITKPVRKRTQPQRSVKVKCKTPIEDIIDLCSDEEQEELKTVNDNSCMEACESKPRVLGVLEPLQPETSAMVSIPRKNLKKETISDSDAPAKENVPTGGRKRKPCPPYKIVEDTTFVVDGFQFGDIPNATHYFLTHYHADHYVGLTRKFAHPLYMSPITASLVRTFIPIDAQYMHEIELDKSITVNDIEVTAIDANHCPGAIMLLFKFKTGKCILHTGDFRACFDMESLPIFWNEQNIDLLYLDTTYLSGKYDFCHQTESIDLLCRKIKSFHDLHANQRILHVCGSYVIGKEKVWMALVEKFGLRVWTEPHRLKASKCLNWPELQLSLCDDPFQANLHVISLGKISYPALDEYFKQFEGVFDTLVGIRPSGWEKTSKPSYGKRISVIGVEYSEHSSCKELERFVRFLKPKRVLSTVPVSRDLFITPKVPDKWYKYKGYGGMLTTGYQPSISTFLQTPKRNKPMYLNSTGMILSPLQQDDNMSNPDSSESCKTVFRTVPNVIKTCPPEATAVCPAGRFSSDASDDLLSFG